MLLALCVGVPLAMAVLHALPGARAARLLPWAGVASCGVTVLLVAALARGVATPSSWGVDRLALLGGGLVALLGLAAALLSAVPDGMVAAGAARRHGAALQAVLGTSLLGLLSASPVLAAAAGGALALAGAAATACGRASRRGAVAARRQAVLGVAAALTALGGAALLAAGPSAGGLAGPLLLAGFMGLAGLAPLQGGLAPDRRGTPPPAAALAALALPVLALVTLLRLRATAALPGWPLLLCGLGSVLLGAAATWRPGPAASRLAAVALWQTGVAAVGFGLGGPGGAYAGLLQLVLHAVAQMAARAALQGRGPGMARAAPVALARLCLSGLVPVGPFAGGVLVLAEAARQAPLAALPLGLGLLAGGLGVLLSPVTDPAGDGAAALPGGVAVALLALLAVLSLAMPPALADWLTTLAGTVAR